MPICLYRAQFAVTSLDKSKDQRVSSQSRVKDRDQEHDLNTLSKKKRKKRQGRAYAAPSYYSNEVVFQALSCLIFMLEEVVQIENG